MHHKSATARKCEKGEVSFQFVIYMMACESLCAIYRAKKATHPSEDLKGDKYLYPSSRARQGKRPQRKAPNASQRCIMKMHSDSPL